jgi:hypothetical protein
MGMPITSTRVMTWFVRSRSHCWRGPTDDEPGWGPDRKGLTDGSPEGAASHPLKFDNAPNCKSFFAADAFIGDRSSAGARNETKHLPPKLFFTIFKGAQDWFSGWITLIMNDLVVRNGYPCPIRSFGLPLVADCARLGARTIGLVTTICSERVSQGLEPIANVSGDIIVLAAVTGIGVDSRAADLHGYC